MTRQHQQLSRMYSLTGTSYCPAFRRHRHTRLRVDSTTLSWTFYCHPRGSLWHFVLPHSTTARPTGHVTARLVPRTWQCGQPSNRCTTLVYVAGRLPAKLSMSRDGRELSISDVCKSRCGRAAAACDSCERSFSSDLQVIQCNASNRHGHDLASAYINVLGQLLTVSTNY